MKNIRKITYVFIALSILVIISCSPERRLHRLVIHHPELLQIDTIKIQDTTFIPETRIDTSVHSETLIDTVVITKEKLKIQLIQLNDTIYIDAYHEPDTIIITKEIPIERIIHTEPEKWFKNFWKRFKVEFVLVLLVLVLLVLVGVVVLVKSA